MSIKDLHYDYPTEAEIEEMWAAYKASGREGILAFLRQRTREWQAAECGREGSHPGALEG